MSQPDMFPWTPQGVTEPEGRFREFAPDQVLDWFDGPRLFTIREGDISYLVYLCQETPFATRYLVSPTDADRLEALTTGALTVFNALKNPVLWAVDTDSSGNATTARRISWSAIPPGVVPKPHVLLSRALEPIFRVYVEGKALSLASTTASVLNRYASNSHSLLDRFFDLIKWTGGVDPPIHQLSLGSLTISYGAPGGLVSEVAARELQAKFEQKIGKEGDPKMVQAITNMCPFKGSGLVDTVTLGGQLIPSTALILARGDRTRWRTALTNLLQVYGAVTVDEIGTLEEIDAGRRTFILRRLASSPEPELRCRADESIINELREEFGEGIPQVRVQGTRTGADSTAWIDQYELKSSAPAPSLPNPET
jgi:hypothetical protein